MSRSPELFEARVKLLSGGPYANATIVRLDTMITSFPKRYGRNKPDPSAVHKSIRMRLKSAREDEVRSIYDLAHIVLDECAKVFFELTKSTDRKPQVMDLFANAIGRVVSWQECVSRSIH